MHYLTIIAFRGLVLIQRQQMTIHINMLSFNIIDT